MAYGVSANSYNPYTPASSPPPNTGSMNGGIGQGVPGVPDASLTPQDKIVYNDVMGMQNAPNMDQASKKLLGDLVVQLKPPAQRLFLYAIMYGTVKTPQQMAAFNKALDNNSNNKLGIITLTLIDNLVQTAATSQGPQGGAANQQGMTHESPASAVVAPASYAVVNNQNLATQNQATSTAQSQTA